MLVVSDDVMHVLTRLVVKSVAASITNTKCLSCHQYSLMPSKDSDAVRLGR